jgi:hypothetical protein
MVLYPLNPIQMAEKKSAPKFRSAETGQYTTKKYAENHPKTTVKETEKKKK